MSFAAIAAFAAAVISYVLFSGLLDRRHVSAPMIFIGVGGLLGGVLAHQPDRALVRGLAELTLALLLFHDAAQVQPRQLRGDAGICVRLLLIALPLTIAAGYLLARLLFGGGSGWLALLLAAALAPTDAGLGAATVLNPVVPVRVRRVLNVESGLNDGLATPIVLFALTAAGAGSQPHAVEAALRELAIGAVLATGVGAGAGYALRRAAIAGRSETGLVPVGTVAVPLLCYYGSVALGGNGFVAAFVAGVAFAPSVAHRVGDDSLALAASAGTLLEYAVWCLFGAIVVVHLGDLFSWQGLLFAPFALTALRMAPVGLVLLGTGFARPTRWFIGWFGPRGLASVVFAVIALEEYPDSEAIGWVVGTITLTVLLSVVLHGITADAWAARYGAWASRNRPAAELGSTVQPLAGRGIRHRGR